MIISNETPCVLAKGLVRRFGGTMALDGLSFTMAQGQVIGLLGRNGAGKSTLLRILSGQLKQNAGDISLFGMPVYNNAAALGELCMISDTPDFGKLRNQKELFHVCAALFPSWDGARAAELAKRLELPDRKPLKDFSRGMQTGMLLCVGLASGARLTIFDEPSLGLDAVIRERFYDLLLETRCEQPERTFIVSTHLIDEVTRTLDYAVMIDHGRLLCEGTPEMLLNGYISVSGAPDAVTMATDGAQILREDEVAGSLVRYLRLSGTEQHDSILAHRNVQCAPIGLQRLFVFLTGDKEGDKHDA